VVSISCGDRHRNDFKFNDVKHLKAHVHPLSSKLRNEALSSHHSMLRLGAAKTAEKGSAEENPLNLFTQHVSGPLFSTSKPTLPPKELPKAQDSSL
jgi:hypothetical protein